MDIKKKIKYFYEYVSSNNLVEEFPKYISDDCTLRIGEKVIPVGIDGIEATSIRC